MYAERHISKTMQDVQLAAPVSPAPVYARTPTCGRLQLARTPAPAVASLPALAAMALWHHQHKIHFSDRDVEKEVLALRVTEGGGLSMPAIDKKRPSPLLRDLTRWTLNDQGVTEVQKVVVGKFAAAILSTRHRLTVLGDHRWTIPPEKLSTCVPARLCPAGQELCAVSSLSGATLCSVLGGDGAAIPVALLRERLQSSLNGAGLKLQEILSNKINLIIHMPK